MPTRNSALRRTDRFVLAGTRSITGYDGLAYDYEVTVTCGADNRATIREVVIRSRSDGPDVLAKKVGDELGRVRTEAARLSTVGAWELGPDMPSSAQLGRALKALTASALRPHRSTPRSELERAARAYTKAFKANPPRSTTAAVVAELNVTPEVARRRVMAARKKGLLPPTTERRALAW